jgi:hypothetical protein
MQQSKAEDKMHRAIRFLLTALATLPAVLIVMFLDSLSKEPYGNALYAVVAASSLVMAYTMVWFLDRRRKSNDRSGPIDQPAISCLASILIGGMAVAWLVFSGH